MLPPLSISLSCCCSNPARQGLGQKLEVSNGLTKRSVSGTGEGVLNSGEESANSPLANVGLRLKKARERKKWSINKLSSVTKISVRHLENIERGEFYRIPSRTLVFGFTKSVCLALSIKPEPVFDIIKNELYDGQEINFFEPAETKKSGVFQFIKSWFGK